MFVSAKPETRCYYRRIKPAYEAFIPRSRILLIRLQEGVGQNREGAGPVDIRQSNRSEVRITLWGLAEGGSTDALSPRSQVKLLVYNSDTEHPALLLGLYNKQQ